MNLFAAATALLLLATPGLAQFSVQGSGTGISNNQPSDGVWDVSLPTQVNTTTVQIPVPVTSIDSIRIHGLEYTWIGDLQVLLADPNGIEHTLFVRPGFTWTGSPGSGMSLVGGSFLFVESGAPNQMPTSETPFTILLPGTFNQSFSTGGLTWTNGVDNVFNTPLSQISGPAGTWTLKFYAWGGAGGNVSGWELYGNGADSGQPTVSCSGDGYGGNCPCSGWADGLQVGCKTTSGTGAKLVGTGDANMANDTLMLSVTGGPANKPGMFFQGNVMTSIPLGDGLLCTAITQRLTIAFLDGAGSTSTTALAANANPGQTLNYQYWFRDPQNACGGGFNFTNGWTVNWH